MVMVDKPSHWSGTEMYANCKLKFYFFLTIISILKLIINSSIISAIISRENDMPGPLLRDVRHNHNVHDFRSVELVNSVNSRTWRQTFFHSKQNTILESTTVRTCSNNGFFTSSSTRNRRRFLWLRFHFRSLAVLCNGVFFSSTVAV